MLLNRKFIKILLDRKYKPNLNEFSNLSCSQIKWYLRIRVGRKLLRYYLLWRLDAEINLVKSIDIARELLSIEDGCRVRYGRKRGKIIKHPELTIGSCFPIILTKSGIIRMSWNSKGGGIKVKFYKIDSIRIRTA